MRRAAPSFSTADVKRALAAWQKLGLPVGAVEIRDNGATIRIEAPREPKQDNPLDTWLAQQGAKDARGDTA